MDKPLMLIPGYYRCQNCGRDVMRVRKTRRWRLCQECWPLVVPPFEGLAETQVQRDQILAYWHWYGEMEQRYPPKRMWRPRRPFKPPSVAQFWPYCEDCGAETPEYASSHELSLFGKPRAQYCPVCEAKHAVGCVFDMAEKIMPERDDEGWLDLLYKSHPEAFKLGVLPDFWYKLRLERVGQ